jgi:hypothetical protein
MKQDSRKTFRLAAGILCAALIFAAPALAGPPLICHPINIGSAQSLPWASDSWRLSGQENYDVSRLVPDTLALLSPSTPVLVRMETLRRATLYAQSDSRIAKELLLRLEARTSANSSDALAAFDFGYLIECYRQAGEAFREGMLGASSKTEKGAASNPAADVNGYAWVKKAIRLRGEDPAMEFAAALITTEVSQSERPEHLQKAIAGAKEDPLLAQNLTNHFGKETTSKMLAKANN